MLQSFSAEGLREYMRACIENNGTCRVAIDSPGYHRSLWYFYKASQADVFLSMDTAPYCPKALQNRQVFYYDDALRRLTVPVDPKKSLLRDARIWSSTMLKIHWAVIAMIYKSTPYFSRYYPYFESIYRDNRTYLVDLCDVLTDTCLRLLWLDTHYVRVRDLHKTVLATHKKDYQNRSYLLLDMITNLLGRDFLPYVTYIAGPVWSRNLYVEQRWFEKRPVEVEILQKAGVHIWYYDFTYPSYDQIQYKYSSMRFVPNLWCIDLLCNYWPQARDVLAGAWQGVS